ncbi:hypothetical protein [Bacillus sp. REN3]|uniref:hypothetical protein n=1 Tax=Bacillus sp. REN3 TaxID=2802440 RepID=UPI001AEE899A|nr:hypothetical protein [Bacillus sp. REN3]
MHQYEHVLRAKKLGRQHLIRRCEKLLPATNETVMGNINSGNESSLSPVLKKTPLRKGLGTDQQAEIEC